MKLGSQTNSKEVKYFYKMSKKNLPVSQKLSENCPKTILKIVQKDRLKNSPQKSTKNIYPKITPEINQNNLPKNHPKSCQNHRPKSSQVKHI